MYFFVYWKYVFCKKKKTYGAYPVRLILSNDAWKAACQIIQSNPEARFAFAREKVKYKKLLGIVQTQNEKIFTSAKVTEG